ncbi:cytochrome d ubiquinol oxidase subunit II [Chitinivorax tropicus]|uniref:Cytochrome d ubiquinol oxidase subunit II n=1 Tax=Chitinivorax tropicus TaxID=714531 RepID=A0A840MIY2_9PROT|nr:cytochrome d ubiquinol oxidase subunit II [Chitinivorax tropicus]MBB5018370.1 cytochrome d ubiquinol oxidase subunit II [Chitinivorax tropicus]
MLDLNMFLPLLFLGLMGLAMLIYVILDGYDLGVGVLMHWASPEEKDRMIAAIGPFWDANETWLVLGVGILLVAFPMAQGAILTALYLPVALMLAGLILRGVAFDFRAKAHADHKARWDRLFTLGSLIAGLAQGFMLGMYVTGLDYTPHAMAFAAVVAVCLVAGYALLGACWLVLKTEGGLQRKAIQWGKRCLKWAGLGIALISIATPWASERVASRWFNMPEFFLMLPIPVMTAALLVGAYQLLKRLPRVNDRWSWAPFACVVGVFVLAFHGLAYSVFPYLIMDRMTAWQGAASIESLKILAVGTLIVLPAILCYTAYSYYVFRGKARDLVY